MKILDFAIDVEQAEHDLYQRLANCTDNLGVKAIFRMVASDERKLLNRLRKLKEDPANGELELHSQPKSQNAISRQQGGSCELLEQNHVRDDLSSYSYILRTEQLLLNLYKNMLEGETDFETRELLEMILAEKQEEIDRLHMLYEFISSPLQFMD